MPLAEARRLLDEKRFRSLGVRLDKGRLVAHPDAGDGPRREPRRPSSRPSTASSTTATGPRRSGTSIYRLEMYVPKAKREYGYYVLPILRGDRIIGRIEPVYDRKAEALHVKGVFAEPGAPAGAGPGIARDGSQPGEVARRDGDLLFAPRSIRLGRQPA